LQVTGSLTTEMYVGREGKIADEGITVKALPLGDVKDQGQDSAEEYCHCYVC
jgi:hypothetical protein